MAIVETVLINFIGIFTDVLTWAIIIRIILSWFSVGGSQPVFRLLVDVTEPVLGPLRRAIPTAGMLDFSPLVALILINIISRLLEQVVVSVAG